VFREIINNLEIKPISPSGVFCLGVYYTRDNTDKDCYIRQGRSQLGAFRTSTIYFIRVVVCFEFAGLHFQQNSCVMFGYLFDLS
jgi:hypothetical protein